MNCALVSPFSVVRFQQPTVSLCYSPKIARLSSLKITFCCLARKPLRYADFSLGNWKERAGAVAGNASPAQTAGPSLLKYNLGAKGESKYPDITAGTPLIHPIKTQNDSHRARNTC